jgi:hypothetical protein
MTEQCIEQQINDAIECRSQHKTFMFTGLRRVDELLTSWSTYTDDMDQPIDTRDGPLYRLYHVPRTEIIAYLRKIDWEQVYVSFSANDTCDCHVQLFKTWVADFESASRWILVYMVVENENRWGGGANLWDLVDNKRND